MENKKQEIENNPKIYSEIEVLGLLQGYARKILKNNKDLVIPDYNHWFKKHKK